MTRLSTQSLTWGVHPLPPANLGAGQRGGPACLSLRGHGVVSVRLPALGESEGLQVSAEPASLLLQASVSPGLSRHPALPHSIAAHRANPTKATQQGHGSCMLGHL